MKALTHQGHRGGHLWIKVCLASAALCRCVIRTSAQGAVAPPTAAASSNPSTGQFAAQMVQGMNLITACGFVAGCVMVMNGFLNARRDENWKMTVIHGLGVAGSVALCKTLFSLFVANGGSIVSQF